MKKQQYLWPLALKLTLSIGLVVIVVAIGLSHLSINREQRTFRVELQQQMHMILEALAVAASAPLADLDIATLQTIVDRLREQQILVSAQFYGLDGRVLAGSARHNLAGSARHNLAGSARHNLAGSARHNLAGSARHNLAGSARHNLAGSARHNLAGSARHNLAGDPLENPFAKWGVEEVNPIFEWFPDRLVGGQQITLHGQRVGAVSIALSTAPLQEKVDILRKQGIEAALIATAISVLVAMLISRTITKPLNILVEAANRLASGGLSQRIEIRSHDELAVLGSAMEHMRAELQELYSTLEFEVSERTRALENRTRELSELNATKDKFFTILSHNLQTPISGLLELISFIPANLENLSQAEFKETLDTMRTSLENFYELLKNLFTWSGLQRGTIQHCPQNLDLQEIVSRNISLLIPIAEEKQVRLKSHIPSHALVYADPDMVYAIIRSLLSNALKFTFPGDSVHVSAITQEGNMVEVSVADTGVGIWEEDLPKLFQPDVSFQTPGTAGEEGTGVGLLLCKELVEQNGGIIWVESQVGEGTTFRFTLPKPPTPGNV